MSADLLAKLYAASASLPMAMHIALAFGAPLGRLTVGGRFPGRLPPLWRGLAMVQAALLAAMASAMLDRAGVIHLDLPPVFFWLALGLPVLTIDGAPAILQGRGFAPGERVEIELGEEVLDLDVIADGDGTFEIELPIPEHLGDHRVVVRQGDRVDVTSLLVRHEDDEEGAS